MIADSLKQKFINHLIAEVQRQVDAYIPDIHEQIAELSKTEKFNSVMEKWIAKEYPPHKRNRGVQTMHDALISKLYASKD